MLWYRWTDTLEQLARTVPSQALGQLSARLFIGSYCSAYTALPKSLPLAYKLLEIGLEVAVSEEEKRTTSYFLANMKRLEAVETKLTHLFAKSGREITNLANSGHAIAQYNCTEFPTTGRRKPARHRVAGSIPVASRQASWGATPTPAMHFFGNTRT